MVQKTEAQLIKEANHQTAGLGAVVESLFRLKHSNEWLTTVLVILTVVLIAEGIGALLMRR